MFYIPAVSGQLVFFQAGDAIQPGPLYIVYLFTVIGLLFAGAGFLAVSHWRGQLRMPIGLIVVIVIFFGISAGSIAIPSNIIRQELVVLAVGLDIVVLGFAIALFDAFEEGETLRLDILRSFLGTLVVTGLFTSQIVVAISLGLGTSLLTLGLLLSVMTISIAVETLADSFQTMFDRVVFGPQSGLSQVRSDLRSAVQLVTRVNTNIDFNRLDDKEFARLTRRAFSHYADLTKLAANPLTQLPVIDQRLDERQAPSDTIERAVELKAVLAENVESLRPRDGGEFGTTDEWRFYNALYFPYVAGLKPYSRRSVIDSELSPVERDALEWFRTSVPERTLYNWQTSAAELIAHKLRDTL